MSSKIDIRAWSSGLLMFGLLLLMPFFLWKGCEDSKNLKNREKKGEAIVIAVKGIKSNKIIFRYIVNGKTFEKKRDARLDYKIKQGDKLKIVYDSLNAENVKVVW